LSLEIKIVENYHQLAAFTRIPRALAAYREPGRQPQPDSLSNYDPACNPVHQHLTAGYFIALREQFPVGRIAAIRDSLNPDPETGFFGCFECENDPEAAAALVAAARQWLINNGCPRMIGPATFNTNQQVGLLIEGHEAGPQIMLPYNPPYYRNLLENAGLLKETDLVTFSWFSEMGIPEKVVQASQRALSNKKVGLRRLNPYNAMAETAVVRDLFNRSMSANWGFIPLTLQESAAMLNYCCIFADPELILTVMDDGQPAGILMFLPASPSGPARPSTVRAAILGVVPEYRHRGLDSCLIAEAIRTMIRKGYRQADISMIHEENKVMIKIITQVIGSSLTRRYRVYKTP